MSAVAEIVRSHRWFPPLRRPRTGLETGAWASFLGLAALPFFAGGATEVFALLLFLAAAWVVYAISVEALPRLATLFVFTTLLNALGWVFEYYGDFPGFDEVAHGLTTTALTGLVGYLCFRRIIAVKAVSPWHLSIAVLAVGIAIGALWEIAEWFMYLISGRPGIIKSLNDTVSDMIWDVLGAALALPILWKDAVRPLRGPKSCVFLFSWRTFALLAAVIVVVWNFAENRGNDALIVRGKREIIEAHRQRKPVEILGRLTDEDLYNGIKTRPDAYLGKHLMFRRTVARIVSPTRITLDADGMIGRDELTVDLKAGMLPEKLTVGDQIEILGQVELVGGEPLVVAEAVLDFAGDE